MRPKSLGAEIVSSRLFTEANAGAELRKGWLSGGAGHRSCSMYPYLLVGLGGALGSMARHGSNVLVTRLFPMPFPLSTLVVNVGGSLLMGVVAGMLGRIVAGWSDDAQLFLAVGVLGGFTTFSAFSLDTLKLLERGELALAGIYVLGSVLMSILALAVGLQLARGLA